MLVKLIKYDFKALSSKYFLMLIVIAISGAVGSLLTFIGKDILMGVLLFMAAFITVAALTVFYILAVIYLYSTLSGKNSGFTFTLPVKISSTVLSKIICIIAWGVITVAALILFWIVFYNAIAANSPILDSLVNSLKIEIEREFGQNGFYNLILVFGADIIFQFIGMLLVTVFSVSLTCYPKFKSKNIGIAAGVIGYFVLYYAFSILLLLFLFISNSNLFITGQSSSADEAYSIMRQVSYLISIGWSIVAVILYFVSTKMFLRHKNV